MNPKNSVPAILNMLEKTFCYRMLSQSAFEHVLAELRFELAKKQLGLEYVELPPLPHIFPQFGGDEADYHVELFTGPDEPPRKDQIVLYLHSSGSTGFPKPVPQSQEAILEWCHSRTSPPWTHVLSTQSLWLPACLIKGREHSFVWASMAMPTFHTTGFYVQLYAPLITGYPSALFVVKYPAAPIVPTPVNHIAAAKATGCNAIAIVPSFIEVGNHQMRRPQESNNL